MIAAAPSDILNFPFVIMGNKVDLTEDRKVSKEEVEEWIKSSSNIDVFTRCHFLFLGHTLLRN